MNSAARISHYSSVFSFGGVSLLSLFAFNFLGDKTGVTRMNGSSPASCQTIQDCQPNEYCIRQSCVSTFTRYHDAYGAGLGYDYSTGLFTVTDASKPTWTESTYVWFLGGSPCFRSTLTYLYLQMGSDFNACVYSHFYTPSGGWTGDWFTLASR